MKRIAFFGLCIVGMTVMGCDTETEFEKRVKADDVKISEYLSSQGITATKDPSGIYYTPLEEVDEGDVVAEANDIIKVEYSVKTLDGTALGSSMDQGAVLYGYQQGRLLPEGLIYGTGLMKEGEKYRFYIPSYLAFGSYNNETLQANSNLIADLQIVDITPLEVRTEMETTAIEHYVDSLSLENVEVFHNSTYDADLYYQELEEGEGSNLFSGEWIEFSFKRMYLDGTVLLEEEDQTVQYLPENFVPGLYDGLGKMKKGGTARILIPSALGFGPSIQVIPQSLKEELVDDDLLIDPVDPYAPLMYEVELSE